MPPNHSPRGIPNLGGLADKHPDGKHPVPAVSAGGGGFPLLRHASRGIAGRQSGIGTGWSLTGVISATATPAPGCRNFWRWTMSSVSTTR